MKSVVFGLIIGILTTVSVTVLGISLATPRVEVWLQSSQVSIMVDGVTLDLPYDSHVLNFNGRLHTPTRLIAESLGATVHWDEVSQTVIIVSPDPQVVQVPVEVPVEAETPSNNVTARTHHSPLPVRRVIQGTSINVTSMEFFLSQTEVKLDLDVRSQWPIMFMRDQTYIEFRGVKYPVEYAFEPIFMNSLPERYEREDLRLIFAPLPEDIIRSGDDIDEIRLVITVELLGSFFTDSQSRYATFEFNIDPSDETFHNF